MQDFNILIVGQSGRLQFEAVIFLASLRRNSPNFKGDVYVASPSAGERWDGNPDITNPDVRKILLDMGAKLVTFESEHFGEEYPYGNKIEALKTLPEGQPFVFFDTDTIILDELSKVPFDFNVPSASNKVQGTWPEIELYGPGYTQTWKSLYDKFGVDFESSLDKSQPDEFWRRYLYFNAGYFYYRCPKIFGDIFTKVAVATRDRPPSELVCQSLDPWLDQVALPIVIHALKGRRDALPEGLLDGSVSCHYRLLPLLYARESDHVVNTLETILAPNKVKKVVKQYDPIKRMVFQKRGAKVRALFDQDNLPKKEKQIRNTIKREGFWMR